MGVTSSKRTSYRSKYGGKNTNQPYSVERDWNRRRGFQEDYQAWLRSLPHLEEEEYVQKRRKSQHHSSRKTRNNKTLFDKISSLFRSKKHREPCIAWPEIRPNNPPPKIRLSFNTNNLRLQELQRQKRQRKSISNLHEQDYHRRSNERQSSRFNQLSTHLNNDDHRHSVENDLLFWDFQSGGIPFHHYDNRKRSTDEINSFCSSNRLRRSHDRISNVSSPHRSSESIVAKHNHTSSSHSSDENKASNSRQYHWDIPVDYNAIQGSASLIGPRVLPPYQPGQRQALHHAHDPSPILSQRSSSSSKYSSHLSVPVSHHYYEPSINDVIEEVKDDFRRQFNSKSSTSTSSSLQNRNNFNELPGYYENENVEPYLPGHNLHKHYVEGPVGYENKAHDIMQELKARQHYMNRSFQKDTNKAEQIRHPSTVNDSNNQQDYHQNLTSRSEMSPTQPDTVVDNDFSSYLSTKTSDDIDMYRRDVNFGPGSENFYLVSTPENSRRNRKGIGRVKSGGELYDQHRQSKEQENVRTVSAIRRNREDSPSNRLWRNSNPIVSSLNSLQDPNFSPYHSHSELPTISDQHYNYKDEDYLPELQKLDNFHQRSNYKSYNEASDSTAYYDTGSVAENTSDSGSVFATPHSSSRDHGRRRDSKHNRSRHKKKSRHARQQQNEQPNPQPHQFDVGLEQKINEMVMGFMGKSMGSPGSREDRQRSRRSRRRRRSNQGNSDVGETGVPSNQVQEMLERQLATALTKIFVPKSPMNRN